MEETTSDYDRGKLQVRLAKLVGGVGILKGVIDPTKVVRSALQNASSIASLLLTTEAMVADIPEPKQEAPAGGGLSRRRRPAAVGSVSRTAQAIGERHQTID